MEETRPDLEVHLLGPPVVLQRGKAVSIPRRKAQALLYYLMSDQRAHARDKLATLLQALRRFSTFARLAGLSWSWLCFSCWPAPRWPRGCHRWSGGASAAGVGVRKAATMHWMARSARRWPAWLGMLPMDFALASGVGRGRRFRQRTHASTCRWSCEIRDLAWKSIDFVETICYNIPWAHVQNGCCVV